MKTKLLICLSAILLISSSHTVLYAQIDDDTFTIDDPEEETRVNVSAIGISNYKLGQGFNFSSKTDSYKVNISGIIQNTVEMTNYNAVDEDNWDQTYMRYRVRRARLRLNGAAMGGKIRYRLGVNMVNGSESIDEGTGATLSDAFVQWRPYGNSRLEISFGQRYSTTDNKESYMSSLSSEFVEKSKLTSAFATNREVGIFIAATRKITSKQYIKPSFALTDGSGPISAGRRYGGIKYGGRLNYLPFGLFRSSGETRFGDIVHEFKPKLVLGVAYSHATRTFDRRGGDGGGPYLYKSSQAAPASGDTDEYILLPGFSKFSADLMMKYRGWSLFGEFVKSWAKVPEDITYRVYADRRQNFGGFNTYDDRTGTVASTDAADYIRNRLVLGSAFNIQSSYMFRSMWNVALRYTHLDPDEYSYLNSKTFYGRDDWYAASLTRWLTNSYAAKIQVSYAMTKPGNGYGRIAQDTESSTSTNDNRTKFHGWENHLWIMFQLAF